MDETQWWIIDVLGPVLLLKDADLFICEATTFAGGNPVHLSAQDVEIIGRGGAVGDLDIVVGA